MNSRRRIPLTGTENTRDLGGYPLDASHMTNYGVFLRSGVPTGLSREDVELMRSMGISTIIDLRSDPELERTPCYFAGLEGFDYHHLNIEGAEGFMNGEDYIGDTYLAMTKSKSMPLIFKILADMKGGCLFHCTAGKDRTGIVAAILELLAGMDESDIIADYSITFPYLFRLIQSLSADYPDLPAYVGRSNPEYMMRFLELFKNEYGSAENYLKGLGLTDMEIGNIKDRLITAI